MGVKRKDTKIVRWDKSLYPQPKPLKGKRLAK
jgi:hypothetical protein